MTRLLLLAVAAVVLWYLGHILLESVWTLARLPADSRLPWVANLLLIPAAAAAAWLLLPRRREVP